MPKSVIGLFDNQRDAQAAERALGRAGFGGEHVSLVQQPTDQLANNLVKAGIPEQDAQIYTQGVQQGGALLVMQAIPDQEAEQAASIVDQHNSVNISRHAPNYRQASLQRSPNAGDAYTNIYEGGEFTIPIVEEELIIRKQEVDRGGVRVDTHVEEVPVEEQVTVRDETVQVQRRQVDRPVSDADLAALESGPIEVHQTGEEVVVDKQARVVEEVRISKDTEERTETVRDTLRHTVVDVDKGPDTTRTSGTAGNISATGSTGASTGDVSATSGTTGEGTPERSASTAGNAVERTLRTDIDRDGDVGQRDPRNNA
jgi:uncharacterized protein (TIGR02271 family)